MAQSQEQIKHSACDECRSRKLKCSGEFPICKRCQDEGIQCLYSPRKTMGRPRKRKKSDNEEQSSTTPDSGVLNHAMNGVSVTPVAFGTPIFDTNLLSTNLDPWSGLDTYNTQLDPLIFNPNTINTYASCLPTPQSLNAIPDPLPNTCNCISTLTNILETIRPLTTFQFPTSVGHIRNSISKLSQTIHCPICPLERGSAMQNIMLLNTVLASLVDRLYILLTSLDTEAKRMDENNETKELRIGDPVNMHAHTGTADCPAGLMIQLTGTQWRNMARDAIRKLVHGPEGTIDSLLDDLEKRQEFWHSDPGMEELRKGPDGRGHKGNAGGHGPGGCLSNISVLRSHVEHLDI